MNLRRTIGIVVAALAVLAAPAAHAVGAGAGSRGGDVRPSITVPDPRESVPDVSQCASTISGRRIACVTVTYDEAVDDYPRTTLCVYDDALKMVGWGMEKEVVCVSTNEDWGYVGAPGACVHVWGNENPIQCTNGKDGCLLWVMAQKFVCPRSD